MSLSLAQLVPSSINSWKKQVSPRTWCTSPTWSNISDGNRGAKKRLHQKPATTRDVRARRPWLDAELAQIEPAVIVTLGTSASQAILGKDLRMTVDHGQVFEWEDQLVVPTIHPPSCGLRSVRSYADSVV